MAKAQFNKGVALGSLNRTADAVDSYQHMIDRYGDDPDPTLRELVGRAGAAQQVGARHWKT